jgi:hypothetical protein
MFSGVQSGMLLGQPGICAPDGHPDATERFKRREHAEYDQPVVHALKKADSKRWNAQRV